MQEFKLNVQQNWRSARIETPVVLICDAKNKCNYTIQYIDNC